MKQIIGEAVNYLFPVHANFIRDTLLMFTLFLESVVCIKYGHKIICTMKNYIFPKHFHEKNLCGNTIAKIPFKFPQRILKFS